MTAFLASLSFVFLAEMGDKTQFLALCLAARYRWQTVIGGLLLAEALSNLIAALVGNYLSDIVPMSYIRIAASVFFIIFGLLTLRSGKEEEKFGGSQSNLSPTFAVAVAFFIAEAGDKTQLAALALAAKYSAIVVVWLGATIGMFLSNVAGIVAGTVLGKKLPERAIKWAAATVFIAFGLYGLYEFAFA